MAENKPLSTYRQQLRGRIVETAMRAFTTHGIRSVKMDDIAQQLGISKRTLYEIYDNKEDLLYEGVKKFKTLRDSEMEDCVRQSRSVMDVILHVYREKIVELNMVAPQFYADLEKYPRVMASLDEDHERTRQRMFEFVQRGIKEGYFRSDVDYALVAQLFDAISYHVRVHQLYRQYSFDHLFRNLVFTTLRGFCTRRGLETLDRNLSAIEHS